MICRRYGPWSAYSLLSSSGEAYDSRDKGPNWAFSNASSQSASAYNAGYSVGASNASTANAAAANANAAAANANAAATNANVAAANASVANVTYQMGAVYGALPAGCISPKVSGVGTYYLCGNTWFSPSYGANGVLYRVVPTP